jgi:sarcosine oxidase subunit gamma
MAELTARAPVFAPSPRVRLLPPVERRILRGRAAALVAAGRALNLDLPQAGGTAAANGCTALWLGPDEFLLLAPPEANACWPLLQTALADLPHACVDVSQRQVAFEVAGEHAAAALNTGCPLDLELAAFPAGHCTRTVFGKAGIILWRTAADRFHVEVWRSFAAYVSRLLGEAERDVLGMEGNN